MKRVKMHTTDQIFLSHGQDLRGGGYIHIRQRTVNRKTNAIEESAEYWKVLYKGHLDENNHTKRYSTVLVMGNVN